MMIGKSDVGFPIAPTAKSGVLNTELESPFIINNLLWFSTELPNMSKI